MARWQRSENNKVRLAGKHYEMSVDAYYCLSTVYAPMLCKCLRATVSLLNAGSQADKLNYADVSSVNRRQLDLKPAEQEMAMSSNANDCQGCQGVWKPSDS